MDSTVSREVSSAAADLSAAANAENGTAVRDSAAARMADSAPAAAFLFFLVFLTFLRLSVPPAGCGLPAHENQSSQRSAPEPSLPLREHYVNKYIFLLHPSCPICTSVRKYYTNRQAICQGVEKRFSAPWHNCEGCKEVLLCPGCILTDHRTAGRLNKKIPTLFKEYIALHSDTFCSYSKCLASAKNTCPVKGSKARSSLSGRNTRYSCL